MVDTPPTSPEERGKPQTRHTEAISTRGFVLLALGVVFGDIGTSPLYAIREAVRTPDYAANPAHVLGVLSLVFWSLLLVVTIKYLVFILRADNHGEGGTFALLALAPRPKSSPTRIPLLAAFVIFGAALLYGDGMITPAISVLSAVEGLSLLTPRFADVVVPLTVLILVVLFWAQRRGTSGIGRIFGPVMAAWFAVLAVFGGREILRNPSVLQAINPVYGFRLFADNGLAAIPALGGVVLTLTGGEALYADMGHVGRRPIRLGWFCVVFPALLLNYFGQGALLLREPSALPNPFYALVPPSLLAPMILFATVAAVIASQAMISGAFSLTRQAVQLGYFPRVTIVHTSKAAIGQIYVPEINLTLALASIALVIGFGSSRALAGAYGIAVIGAMVITTIVYFVVLTQTWKWPLWRALPLVTLFLVIDLSFFGANLPKIPHGGWFPIAVAAVLSLIMATWKSGRRILAAEISDRMLPLPMLIDDVADSPPLRVPGVAVFLASNPNGVPLVLLHHLKHNKMLHENVVLLSVLVEPVPEVPRSRKVEVRELGHGFYQVLAHYGFMETPNVPRALEVALSERIRGFDLAQVSYFLGRESLRTTGRGKMSRWRKSLFAFISRNARSADHYFCIPPDRVVEIGVQIGL